MKRLVQLLSIKQGESRMASLTIGVMLFTAMGAAFGGTGIEALFFARFGVDYLPYMFIGLGITSMLTSFVITAALGRIPKAILYTAIPLLIAALLLCARLALLTKLLWLYPVLWLGKEVLNSLINLVIWGVAGVVCDTRQAKRLFPLFNASRILGQVIGGFATGVLVGVIGTENLLIVWAVALIFAFLFSRTLLAGQQISAAPESRRSKRKQPTLAQEMQRGYQYVRGSTLMGWIAVSTIFFSILYFSISLPFSRAATQQFADENSLAAFLGLFNGLSTAAAFLTSLLLANRLFTRFGIMLCILAFPIIYLIGFGALAVAPLFAVIVAFRFAQMLWLAGIADPAWQSMFNVVPPEKRDQVRTFIGGVPEQAGTFIAGGILIIGEQTLTPQQLYLIGFSAAAACTYIIFQARRGYHLALVEALRAGRPNLLFSEERPFGGFRQDAATTQAALNGLRDADPILRRVSAEIVGHLSLPESTNALINGLSDVDPLVRAACLKALSQSKATPALLDIAASLSDPEPDVRFEAVSALSALSALSHGLTTYVAPLLDDSDTRTSVRAAISLLLVDPHLEKAQTHLRTTAAFGDVNERLHAIQAMGEWRDPQAFDFLCAEVYDLSEPSAIRSAAAEAMVQVDPVRALPHLFEVLDDPDISLRQTLARLLGGMGKPALESSLAALFEKNKEDGALSALAYMARVPAGPVLEFARVTVTRASEYHALRRGINSQSGNEALILLAESLHAKSHQYGMQALRAVGLLSDRDSMNLAIDNLQTRNASQQANVLEALDSISAKYRELLQPLMKLWEDESTGDHALDWERVLNDDDAWIRECAAFAQSYGGTNMDTPASLSLMDRILFFKRVHLLENLSPVDLKQVALIAEEEDFADGEVIAQQGEVGDTLFVIVTGEVRVCITQDGQEVEAARRKPGEYVGELSVINREPRIATLIAAGEVRALCIERKNFEGLIRERPNVSLAIIQVLGKRLKEATEKR